MSIAEKLLTIAENEQLVYDAGFKAGQSQGGGGDTEAAFEEGRKAERSAFWDAFQHNGTRTLYQYAFNYNVDSTNFYPKYDIICVGSTTNLFYNTSRGELFSLTQRLKDCGVILDTSQATTIGGAFAYCSVMTEIPTIDLTSVTDNSTINNLFASCKELINIEMLIMKETNVLSGCFSNCSKLEKIIVNGTIGKNGFDIHWSTKLSKESLLSILGACNIDVTSSPVTITLPSKCIDGATDTKTLLEGLGGKIEYTQGLETANGQLKHTNIVPNSVIITPYGPDGNQCNAEWNDDGNGNIINPYYPTDDNMHIMGSINYETGECTLPTYIEGFQESVKIQYRVESPYTKALANGYKIEFA